ncbi:Programmed cell death protein 2 [Intoshia linei]|uniref:Programmed cell death protein 2 n=1 Tax=Intoshia linei TaxID=1819745 RepID=A0A177BC16_9BILA|nr:Programmed cell death protein 2 [Intoshia linei]
MKQNSLLLGFINSREKENLDTFEINEQTYLDSKIGGFPHWLDFKNLCEIPTCTGTCEKPLKFLLQIYAPIKNIVHAFHRTLYIFVCGSKKCDNRNFFIIRCQMPEKNEIHTLNFFQTDNPYFETVSKVANICVACGVSADKKCSKCMTFYCSKFHQISDWPVHKDHCKCGNSPKKSQCWPEFQISIYSPEPIIIKKNESLFTHQVSDLLPPSLETLSIDSQLPAEPFNEFTDTYENSIKDIVFYKFRKSIHKYPDQIIRYDRGATPLWISGKNKILKEDIPHCTNCGANRVFEFQVMPQLLNYIELPADNELDWGILSVYTCTKSCEPKTNKSNYVQEFLHVQQIKI